jgi:hypothetical protein
MLRDEIILKNTGFAGRAARNCVVSDGKSATRNVEGQSEEMKFYGMKDRNAMRWEKSASVR